MGSDAQYQVSVGGFPPLGGVADFGEVATAAVGWNMVITPIRGRDEVGWTQGDWDIHLQD